MTNERAGHSKQQSARAAWMLIMSIFKRPEPQKAVTEAAETIGIHPGALKALFNLETPQAMNSIAESMLCDASYVTSLADDLEAIGYVERITSPEDGRVKMLKRTKQGELAMQQAMERIVDPPEFILRASKQELDDLAKLLEKIMEDPVGDEQNN